MNTIVIAIDGSQGAQVAVEQGLELAQATGADVTFVAVRQPPLPIYGDPYWQRAVSAELSRLRPVVSDAMADAERLGVDAEYEILEGEAAEEIVRIAKLRDADLIVVGSRGRGTVASAVLGSVSRRVAHEADRPVLIAKERVRLAQPSCLSSIEHFVSSRSG